MGRIRVRRICRLGKSLSGSPGDVLNGDTWLISVLADRFTSKGIVALVFSCISGVLGSAVIVWYGFKEINVKR